MPLTDHIPQPYRQKAMELAQVLPNLGRVIISAHLNPDGDALGSVAACAYLLQHLGKDVVLYSVSGIPEFLRFLPLPAPLLSDLSSLPFTPEQALLVDLGQFHRIGGDLETYATSLPIVNIDHHEGEGIGTLACWVEPKAAACAQLIAYVALALNIPLQGELGRAIGLGLVTDTGGFAHGNTSAEVFDLAALLMRNGLDMASLREDIDSNIRHERFRLWGKLTEHVEFHANGRIALCPVSRQMLAEARAQREDLEGFVEYLRRLRGVTLSAVVREDEPQNCKFSLRSQSAIDVCAVAKTMQGGGHRNAAGGNLKVDLSTAKNMILQALRSVLF
ncbi:MAG: bifunctional oligoribonuclease/PAP phosphatase NrnA [Desulfovibrio sp.]|nr:bifunctional oligoribonuclease/PAP phosphatase NrnA [Desulfovibrio sp.]